jgi:hypothetical protein
MQSVALRRSGIAHGDAIGARDRAVALGTVTRPPVTEMHRGFKKHIVHETALLIAVTEHLRSIAWSTVGASAKRLAHSRATYLPCAKRPQ